MGKFEQITCAFLIAVSLLAGYVLIEQRISPPTRTNRRTSVDALIGKKMNLKGASWDESSQHIVVVLNSHCVFCVASLPFYRQLGGAIKANGAGTALTIVSSEPVAVTQQFLADNGVVADHILSSPLNVLGVSATPTMLLTNSKGVVVKAFVGHLAPANEALIMKAIVSQPNVAGKG